MKRSLLFRLLVLICAGSGMGFAATIDATALAGGAQAMDTSLSATDAQQQDIEQFLAQSKAKIVKHILPNGFTILVYPLQTTQQVMLQIVYRVGAKDEAPQERGNAHFVEHLLFSGTKKMSESDIDEIAEKFCIGSLGGGFNASTWYDKTQYYFVSDQQNWRVFAGIMADCMKNARFGEEQVVSELKRILEELKYRNCDLRDNPFGELMPKDHPYHISPGGFAQAMVTRTSKQLRSFYKKHYRPDKAALIVVGNVDPQEVVSLATTLFSGIKSPSVRASHAKTPDSAKPAAIKKAEPFLKEREFFKKEVTIYRSVPYQSHHITWVIPGLRENNTPAFDALDSIVGKRLQRLLKDEKDLVLTVGNGGIQFDLCGISSVDFSPKADSPEACSKVVQQCRDLIFKEMEKIRAEGVTQTELDEYIKCSRFSFLKSFDNIQQLVNHLTDGFTLNGNEYEAFDNYRRAQTLALGDIQGVAQKYFSPIDAHTISIIPHPEGYKTLWEARQKEIDAYDAQMFEMRIRTTPIEAPKFVNKTGEPKLIDFNFEAPDETFTLSNGLTVYYKIRTATPFVSWCLSYKNEEQMSLAFAQSGKGMLPSLTMSSLDNGVGSYSKHDLEDFFDQRGMAVKFGASVSGSVLSDDLSVALNRVFYIIQNPTFPAQYFDQWQQDLLKELSFQKELPQAQMRYVMSRYFKSGYPWSRTLDEQAQIAASYQQTDLVAFYQQYFTPTNFYLVVAGNVDVQTLKSQLEAATAQWVSAGSALPVVGAIPDLTNPPATEMTKSLPQKRDQLMIARLSPKLRTPESIALSLLDNYLSRKIHLISQKESLFYGSGWGSCRGATTLLNGINYFATQTSPSNTQAAKERILALIAEVNVQGITQEVLDKAKMAFFNDLGKMQETNGSIVSVFSHLIDEGLGWNYYNTLMDTVRALTLDTVNQVVKDCFDPTQWSVIIVGRGEDNLPAGVTF